MTQVRLSLRGWLRALGVTDASAQPPAVVDAVVPVLPVQRNAAPLIPAGAYWGATHAAVAGQHPYWQVTALVKPVDVLAHMSAGSVIVRLVRPPLVPVFAAETPLTGDSFGQSAPTHSVRSGRIVTGSLPAITAGQGMRFSPSLAGWAPLPLFHVPVGATLACWNPTANTAMQVALEVFEWSEETPR